MEAAVEIRHLKKTFDGREYVLSDLNLIVPKGQITAIIGFSGTGKSVLLKHILGLISPTEGEVRVLGKVLNDLSYEELTEFRCHLGVLFQNSALFDDMTVIENVSFPMVEHRPGWGEKRIRETAARKLNDSGMDEKHFQKLPEELSGGQRKRVGLARALALDPDIILYDEPTTGLDPILTEMVDDLILSTHEKNKGSTSIMVSHDLPAAFRISDFIVMLDKGGVLLQGDQQTFFDSQIPLVRRFLEKGFKRDES